MVNYRMIRNALFTGLFLLPLQGRADSVGNLQVNYTREPIGIDDAHPSFSWLMQSSDYAARQTAYRLVVATSREALDRQEYVYDSGRKPAATSVDIRTSGFQLAPRTRYYWQVTVWNARNQTLTSPADWFETGLMVPSNWQGAQWIGSSETSLSPYRTRFSVDYDFQLRKGSRQANFLFGARNDRQYMEITVDCRHQPLLRINKVLDGKTTQAFQEDLSSVLTRKNLRGIHHIRLDADGPRGYSLHLTVDGQRIKNSVPADPRMSLFGPPDAYAFSVSNDGPDEPNPDSRLYRIGFCQPEGEDATFSNIRISENAWNTTLYTDPQVSHSVKGDGKVFLWQPGTGVSAPMLRKEITLGKPVAQARLYATARGIYQFYVNGQQVGKDYMNPGWTDYRKRIMYNTFDITSALRQGDNAVGVTLGDGWYAGPLGFNSSWADQYGVQPSVMALIAVRYTDGTTQYIATDGSWRCYDAGPVVANSLLNGEDYDARKEAGAWSSAGYQDSSWKDARVFQAPDSSVILQGYVGSPVQNHIILKARSVRRVGDTYIYDFGQNFAGIPRLAGMKGTRGRRITVHYAEMLFPEEIPTRPVAPYTVEMYRQKKGQMYLNNYRSALSTDHYTFRGDEGGEDFMPLFTQHGFRYLSITGLDAPLPLDSVQGIVEESVGKQQSSFETSNREVNRLFNNIVWGERSNFLSIPTDCPQRDERCGWTGDAQVFSRAATYNMNVDAFYHRWLYTMRDDQAVSGGFGGYYPDLGNPPQGASDKGSNIYGGWQESGVIIPWQVYQQYGDRKVLEEQYPAMKKFMAFLMGQARDYIQPFGGTGDWLGLATTNSVLSNTAFSAYAARIMQKTAAVLGHPEDAQAYGGFCRNVNVAFSRMFFNDQGFTTLPADVARKVDPMAVALGMAKPVTVKGNDPVLENTQTSYVLPLQFGMLSGGLKEKAARHLHETLEASNYTLTTGFIGTPYICQALSDNGLSADAYRLFTQTAYPSWLFTVRQGATTMWERWNSYTRENGFGPDAMNSFNHYAYGAVEEWMMSRCLGIERDESQPGYKHFFFRPEVGEPLEYARGGFESVYGDIRSSWQKDADGVTYQFTVPANTSATLFLPAAGRKQVRITEGSKYVRAGGIREGKSVYELPAGKYVFKVLSVSTPED